MILRALGMVQEGAGRRSARLLDERHMIMRGSSLIWTVVGVLLIIALVIFIF